MLNIAITGGCGFIAQHLIKYLQDNCKDEIDSILLLDKKNEFNKYLEFEENISMKFIQIELTDLEAVKHYLKNVNVVFHLARKRIKLLFDPSNECQLNESYIDDNITATETVIDAMIENNVEYLIFLSDAYCNLPIEDNFGLNEDNHPGISSNFIMGKAGETRIRAEMIARNYVGNTLANGKTLKGVFPRPVFLYGEGDKHIVNSFKKVYDYKGYIPHVDGSSRGMFQYIYAGNFASLLFKIMKTLINNPEKCNGDYFYCMDDPKAYKTIEFFTPMLESINISFGKPQNYLLSMMLNYVSEYKDKLFGYTSDVRLSLTSFCFLFCYSYGFSNRKEQLTINHQPIYDKEEAVLRTTDWLKQEYITKMKLNDNKKVLRMG